MIKSRSTAKRGTPDTFVSSQEELDLRIKAEAEYRKRVQAKKEKFEATMRGWEADFPAFATRLKTAAKDRTLIPVQSSPILELLEKHRTGRDVILKARQVFMTTWELARDIWFFMVKNNSNVVVLCQSSNDNAALKGLSERLTLMFDSLKEFFPDAPFKKMTETKWARTDGTTGTLQIKGAGATEAAANKVARGLRIDRLHVTEVAFFEFPYNTFSSILEGIPHEDTGSEIVFETTPHGAAGYFYEIYMLAKRGESGFYAHFFPWFMQQEYRTKLFPGEKIEPRTEREKELVALHKITPEQLKWYRQKVSANGQAKTDQEYASDQETCWLFDGRTFFEKESLYRLKQEAREPDSTLLAGACRIWQAPRPSMQYVVAVDPSGGVGGDPVAIVVFEKETGIHCATISGQFPPEIQGHHAATIAWKYNKAVIIVERTSSHDAVHLALRDWERPSDVGGKGYPNVYVHRDKQYGFPMNTATRPAVMDGLERGIRTGSFITHDIEIIKEAQLFIVIDEKPQAASGAHDDLILACSIAWDLLKIPEGLKHTQFAKAPSIAFENTPAAFEGTFNVVKYEEQEIRRWAGGTNNNLSSDGIGSFAAVISGPGDMDGF